MYRRVLSTMSVGLAALSSVAASAASHDYRGYKGSEVVFDSVIETGEVLYREFYMVTGWTVSKFVNNKGVTFNTQLELAGFDSTLVGYNPDTNEFVNNYEDELPSYFDPGTVFFRGEIGDRTFSNVTINHIAKLETVTMWTGSGAGMIDERVTVTGWQTTVVQETALPEPATWGLVILGFGMTGAALRLRRLRPRRTTRSFA